MHPWCEAHTGFDCSISSLCISYAWMFVSLWTKHTSVTTFSTNTGVDEGAGVIYSVSKDRGAAHNYCGQPFRLISRSLIGMCQKSSKLSRDTRNWILTIGYFDSNKPGSRRYSPCYDRRNKPQVNLPACQSVNSFVPRVRLFTFWNVHPVPIPWSNLET